MSINVTKPEASLLRNVQSHEAWGLIERILADRIRDIQAEQVNGTNEFETLRMLHTNQGGAAALTTFFADIDKWAHGVED